MFLAPLRPRPKRSERCSFIVDWSVADVGGGIEVDVDVEEREKVASRKKKRQSRSRNR